MSRPSPVARSEGGGRAAWPRCRAAWPGRHVEHPPARRGPLNLGSSNRRIGQLIARAIGHSRGILGLPLLAPSAVDDPPRAPVPSDLDLPSGLSWAPPPHTSDSTEVRGRSFALVRPGAAGIGPVARDPLRTTRPAAAHAAWISGRKRGKCPRHLVGERLQIRLSHDCGRARVVVCRSRSERPRGRVRASNVPEPQHHGGVTSTSAYRRWPSAQDPRRRRTGLRLTRRSAADPAGHVGGVVREQQHGVSRRVVDERRLPGLTSLESCREAPQGSG